LIFISLVDVKSGLDEEAYSEIESLGPDEGVTPLLVGRIFEESDILLLLHSNDLTTIDDYLIEHVRKSEAAQELTLIPIYEFKLLPAFEAVTELNQEIISEEEAQGPIDDSASDEEFLMIMAKIDVAPTMDKHVQKTLFNIEGNEQIIPLMAGHTFHSQEFDVVLFFLTYSLDAAWEYVKYIRTIDGVWDTSLGLLAHFEALVPLEDFRKYASN
jgi:hypothetical protein